jgi:hypothetical protein
VKKWVVVISAVFAFLLLSKNASALVFVEAEGSYLYFPKEEQTIASRLKEQLPDMLSFLSLQGLAIKPGFHIVLDEQLDFPEADAIVIPHREIRIPLRAPGVLEDGYTEADPWSYFLFKGLCLQGIYGIRSGIIQSLYWAGFGELMSPNAVLPSWVEEGVCGVLWAQYKQKKIQDPFEEMIFRSSLPPDLDIISNHPETWPGYHGYRIYGKPFLFWLRQEYGWNRMLEFLRLHGRGVVPLEVDLKARKAFGKTGSALWKDFQGAFPHETTTEAAGLLALGYWGEPFVYWNWSGVYPGKTELRRRGRYGVVDLEGVLWISQYDRGILRIYKVAKGAALPAGGRRMWDPGPGGVAISCKGSRPYVMILPDDEKGGFRRSTKGDRKQALLIPAPPGVIQISGPVRDARGRIAVAANLAGNWDIWTHDGQWHRLTETPSIELDPWWETETLVYASNLSGKFQIYAANRSRIRRITAAEHGAVLPRQGRFLNLGTRGWKLGSYEIDRPPADGAGEPRDSVDASRERSEADDKGSREIKAKPYTPLKSVWPNYIRPDVYAGPDDFQIGLATSSRDVTGKYLLDGGIRYSFDQNFIALRVGLQAKGLGTQFTRYPLSYETELDQEVEEGRNEVRLFWRPLESRRSLYTEVLRPDAGIDFAGGLELSLNWRNYEPLRGEGSTEDEWWLSAIFAKQYGILNGWGNLEIFSEGRQALSGGLGVFFGEKIFTSLHLMGGKTWGNPVPGHNSFRVGGDVLEGYFTRRPSRLFPLRGFQSNLLEGPLAATAGLEVFWPLANLQSGYQSLPLFLHRMHLGTFADTGLAGDSISRHDLLLGAGIELVTSLEIAWKALSTLRIGVAWPLAQPDYLNEGGPVFVFQVGGPL